MFTLQGAFYLKCLELSTLSEDNFNEPLIDVLDIFNCGITTDCQKQQTQFIPDMDIF